jgi:hypothetical protein
MQPGDDGARYRLRDLPGQLQAAMRWHRAVRKRWCVMAKLERIKPGQARALERCLRYERCPYCNRSGRVVAKRVYVGVPDDGSVAACPAQCGHCSALVTVKVRFELIRSRWQADVRDLTSP